MANFKDEYKRLAAEFEANPENFKNHSRNEKVKKYRKPQSAAQMEALMVEFLRLKGHQAQKITTMGVWRNGHWTKATATLGAADTRSTIFGLDFQFEVKFSEHDYKKADQKTFQDEVERAGGKYYIVRTLDEFLDKYNEVMELPRVELMKTFLLNLNK